MDWSFRRRSRGPSSRSFVGSFLVHAGVAVIALVATLRGPDRLDYITYEIEIVSPPPQQTQEEEAPAPQEELVVERPDPTPPEPEPEAEIPPPDAEEEVAPDPEPEPAQEEAPEPEPEPAEEDAAPTPVEPEETEELSGEDIEVRMEGLRQDFPEYYNNIIRQITRCFRAPPNTPPGVQTTIRFFIRKDGTASDVDFVERSGNFDFDFSALASVSDCAGQGRFGPLPEAIPFERVPIIFDFKPSGGR